MKLYILAEVKGEKYCYLKDESPRGSDSKYITRSEETHYGSKEYLYTLNKTIELCFDTPNINFGHIYSEIQEELTSPSFLETTDTLCPDEWSNLSTVIKEIKFIG